MALLHFIFQISDSGTLALRMVHYYLANNNMSYDHHDGSNHNHHSRGHNHFATMPL
jgi:hypothetical protein